MLSRISFHVLIRQGRYKSSNKSVSKTVTVSETKKIKPSVLTEVKDTEHESKLNELTKLVQMIIDEKVNPKQMTQESSKIQKTESSKSVASSRMNQDSKHKVQNTGSSRILYCMICKREDHRTSDHEMYITSLKRSENYKAQPYQYASSSKQILKAKANPFPPCTHYGFKDHRPDDYRNYLECEICGSYDHFTSGHNRVIHIRGGVLSESSQSNESLIGVKCNTCERTVHSTSDHNEFDHFKIEQNGIAKRKNRTLIEAGRIMLNGSVLSKQFRTEAVKIACYTKNISIIVKRHDKIPYEIFKERIPDISNFHMFGCPVFIHNHKDHLRKFDAKANDGYFLGYSFVSKAFRVYNTRRQQTEETYHVTFDKSMETLDFDISYYVIPDGRSLTELTQENHVPEVIIPNEHDVPLTKDIDDPPDLIKTEGTHEQNVQDDQRITQPTDVPSGNNTKASRLITEPLVPDVPQSHIPNQASISSHLAPQDRWSRDQHIELLNIIGNPSQGMLTRSMASMLTATSASECLFADFVFDIEPKKVFEVLKHPKWIDAMQEELNQFYRNKVWTFVPIPYGKIAIGLVCV
nr:hypothetical protein [Tanacetum cinerariifolium]